MAVKLQTGTLPESIASLLYGNGCCPVRARLSLSVLFNFEGKPCSSKALFIFISVERDREVKR